MPRPVWSGTVSFGLVSVPVQMWSAVADRRITFREIHEKDGSPVKHVRYCVEEDKPVDPSETGRAYEIDEGKLIPVSDEELEQIAPEKTGTIEIESFTPREQVDPLHFERPYNLVPGDRSVGTLRAYRLLVAAMGQGDLLALGRFVMRSREYLAAMRVYGEGLALSTMHFPAEIRSAADLPSPDGTPEKAEVRNAIAVIGERTSEWKPQAFADEYRARLKKLIERKRKGSKIKAPATAEEDRPTAAPDLMAALKQTLSESRGKRRKPRDLGGLSKQELYELATERGLKGRSSMNRKQLLRELRR